MKRGLCTHKNGITTATKYCPECGRLGLEFHETGGNHWISGGNVMDNEGFYYVCNVCGYEGDGELVPPEMNDTIEEEYPIEDYLPED